MVTAGDGGATGIQQVKARDTAQPPTVQKTVPSPPPPQQRKILLKMSTVPGLSCPALESEVQTTRPFLCMLPKP